MDIIMKLLAFILIFVTECWCGMTGGAGGTGAGDTESTSESQEMMKTYPGCGVKENDNIQFLDAKNSYPWIASVHVFKQLDSNMVSFSSMCTATLIHPRFLITAAHCLASGTIDNTVVTFGTEPAEDMKNFNYDFFSNIHIHPDFNKTTENEFKNSPDVALLELEQAVELGKTLNAICLPSIPTAFDENRIMEVAGFDRSDYKAQLNSVRVLSNEACISKNGYDFLKR